MASCRKGEGERSPHDADGDNGALEAPDAADDANPAVLAAAAAVHGALAAWRADLVRRLRALEADAPSAGLAAAVAARADAERRHAAAVRSFTSLQARAEQAASRQQQRKAATTAEDAQTLPTPRGEEEDEPLRVSRVEAAAADGFVNIGVDIGVDIVEGGDGFVNIGIEIDVGGDEYEAETSATAETSVTVDSGAEATAAVMSSLTDPRKLLVDEIGPCAVSGVRVEEPAPAASLTAASPTLATLVDALTIESFEDQGSGEADEPGGEEEAKEGEAEDEESSARRAQLGALRAATRLQLSHERLARRAAQEKRNEQVRTCEKKDERRERRCGRTPRRQLRVSTRSLRPPPQLPPKQCRPPAVCVLFRRISLVTMRGMMLFILLAAALALPFASLLVARGHRACAPKVRAAAAARRARRWRRRRRRRRLVARGRRP